MKNQFTKDWIIHNTISIIENYAKEILTQNS